MCSQQHWMPLSFLISQWVLRKHRCLDGPGVIPGLGTAALAPERGSSTGILSKSLTLGDDSGKTCQDRKNWGMLLRRKLLDFCWLIFVKVRKWYRVCFRGSKISMA